MTKLWPLSGAIHPPQNKHTTCFKPSIRLPEASRFYLSLFQDRGMQLGDPLRPVVAIGDTVQKGQTIACGVGLESVPLHAPTSGRISQILDWPLNHPSGNNGPHLELISDGLDQWCALKPNEQPYQLDKRELLRLIQEAGICGMGGAGYPTAAKLSTPHPIHTLILNGTECEPYITADDRLMQEETEDLLSGARLCASILGAKHITIAIEDNKPQAIRAINSALKTFSPDTSFGRGSATFELVALPTQYPSGGTKQLVQILTGQQVPSGQQATSLGLMVINVATVRAVWRAVRWGEPLIERLTTLVGEALSQPCNVWVPIGTPARHLLTQLGWQGSSDQPLILGGPLMGFSLNLDAPLGKTSNCVIAPSAEEMPPPPIEAPCIRCGQCDSVCPAQLLPQQLFWYAKTQDTARLTLHNLFDCIECGACSYVCPSAIPLVQHYRHAKAEIRTQQATKLKADQARNRFEAHQARVAQQEAEKDAKRLARKNANAAINETLKAELSQANTSAITPAPTVQSTQELAAKLQRHQQSAQERLERLIAQEINELDPARKEKIAASIKQAQLRLTEAQGKIAELNQQSQSVKITAKLNASPQDAAAQVLTTLHKQLAITEQKLLEAEKNHAPSLNALTLAVEKLRVKIQQAHAEHSIPLAAFTQNNTPVQSTPVSQPDAATLAAAAQALANFAAKKTQTSEEKQNSLKVSLEKRITQLRTRIADAKALSSGDNNDAGDAFSNSDKVAILHKSLAELESRLEQLKNDT